MRGRGGTVEGAVVEGTVTVVVEGDTVVEGGRVVVGRGIVLVVY